MLDKEKQQIPPRSCLFHT